MNPHFFSLQAGFPGAVSRRRFVTGTVAAGASLVLGKSALGQTAAPANPQKKIKVGLVGCGGRGSLIGSSFKTHGGFELWAVADYFPTVADKAGDALGVDPSRRFSGLSGYRIKLRRLSMPVAMFTWRSRWRRMCPGAFKLKQRPKSLTKKDCASWSTTRFPPTP